MHHTHRAPVRTTQSTRPTFMSRFRRAPARQTVVVEEPVAGRAHGLGLGHRDEYAAERTHGGYGGGATTRRSRFGNRAGVVDAPVRTQRRHASIGDKISGAMLRLKGSLTHRPGVKAAGTRRMHGTDGRGSHRVY